MVKNNMGEVAAQIETQLNYVPRRMKVVRVVECTGLDNTLHDSLLR